jgi:hypothetical protein
MGDKAMPPVSNPSRNGRPVKVRPVALPHRQPVVAQLARERVLETTKRTLRERVRRSLSRFAIDCVETLTVECFVLALLHAAPPAAVAALAVIFSR